MEVESRGNVWWLEGVRRRSELCGGGEEVGVGLTAYGGLERSHRGGVMWTTATWSTVAWTIEGGKFKRMAWHSSTSGWRLRLEGDTSVLDAAAEDGDGEAVGVEMVGNGGWSVKRWRCRGGWLWVASDDCDNGDGGIDSALAVAVASRSG